MSDREMLALNLACWQLGQVMDQMGRAWALAATIFSALPSFIALVSKPWRLMLGPCSPLRLGQLGHARTCDHALGRRDGHGLAELGPLTRGPFCLAIPPR